MQMQCVINFHRPCTSNGRLLLNSSLRRRRRLPFPSAAPSFASSFSCAPSSQPWSTPTPSSGIRGSACAFATRPFHASTHRFSDTALVHPPVARTVPTTSQQNSTPTPATTLAVTTGGGVWAQTSSKRDKLNELLTEMNASGVNTGILGMETLDEAVNAQDKLDLEFADGLKMIATFVDGGRKSSDATDEDACQHLGSDAAKNATDRMFQLLEGASSLEEWDKPKFDATMQEAMRILSVGLPPDPTLKKPEAGTLDASHPLCYMREFVGDSPEDGGGAEGSEDAGGADDEDAGGADDEDAARTTRKLDDIVARAFSSSTELYRALLLRATAQTLLDNWDALTTYSSGDIDRAAVAKTPVPPQRPTLNAKDIQRLFASYSNESCQEWVQSWWQLIDADGDGLIDEEEAARCIDFATTPVRTALRDMMHMSLEVCPVRTAALGTKNEKGANDWFLGGEHISDLDIGGGANPSPVANAHSTLSWRDRRRELKARKALTNTLQTALDRHFRDQVEMPHRLRCIYAWADKAHQDNKRDSILVDASGEWGAASSLVGRQRYVELEPKISYAEFRREQKRHFPHLDHVGEELAMSFKEDLWVRQGKTRQNKELRQHCALFLLGISAVDVVIGML